MIEKKAFGNTGQDSTRVIFGGAAFLALPQEEADRTFETLRRYGVNHIDVAASYGDAELHVAPLLRERREEFFLATKTGERTYEGAKREFALSLERLGVNHVDLIQLHNLVDPDEWETALGKEGALRALLEAKAEGRTRFIGVTGHGMLAPRMHLRSLEEYDFDSVLLPYNFVIMQNEIYAAAFDELVTVCKRRNVAVQTIKSIARRPWGDRPKTRNCWYEPFESQDAIDKAVSWVLANPDVFLSAVADVGLLPKVLEAASRAGSRPADEEMLELMNFLDAELIFEGKYAIRKDGLR